MFISDLTVEIRNDNYERIAQIPVTELVGATFVSQYNNVGSWSVQIPNGYAVAELLRTPGYGIIVTGPNGTIISGPTVHASLEQETSDVKGTWVISGVDDSVLLADHLAYPTPSTADVTAQTQAYDAQTDYAETVIKGYVTRNISESAGTIRAIDALTVETDLARGAIVTASARFNNLQELLFDLADTGGIGYTIEQNDNALEFKVYEPVDRTSTVRMDIANNKVDKTQYQYAHPTATRVVIAGSGEAEERLFYEGTTTGSTEAEALWNRRVEAFIDDRGSDTTEQFSQKSDEYLTANGSTGISVAVTPTDDVNMRYGYDWGLGDRVTVVVDDIEASSVVTSVGIKISGDGIRIAATLGQPVSLDFESKVITKVSNHENRISNIERNTTGYGVDTIYQPGGGSTGTMPVFPASAITGSYTRFGNMIHFSILVEFTGITSFGTGQYYLTLPYNVAHSYDLRDGCLHDVSASTQFHISGHVNAGSNTLYLSASDKIGSSIQDVAFTSTVPVTLTTSDRFHIAGTVQIQ
jgi:hypothetical protein